MSEEVVIIEPETCVVCGKPATVGYPDDEHGEPSCGRAECELRMQFALDYNDECGDR